MTQTAQRVLFGTQSVSADFGGPAVSVATIARGLRRIGTDVALLTGDGSSLTDLPIGALGSNGDYILARSFGIWSIFNLKVCRWARRQGVPLIISPLGMLEPWALQQKPFKKWLAWQLYQRRDLSAATVVHVTSAMEMDAVRALSIRRPIALIPHGVDLPASTPSTVTAQEPAPVRTALMLSRLHPKKGAPLLIEAWAKVRPIGWRLVIAGPDVDGHREEISRLVHRHGLESCIEIRDAVFGDAKDLLWRDVSLFVLPTYSENFGIVVAEAQARAIPVITTTGTPWRELLELDTGWWIAPEVAAIETALREATELSADALRMKGERGRILMQERYSWEASVQKHAALHLWCIRGGQPPEFVHK